MDTDIHVSESRLSEGQPRSLHSFLNRGDEVAPPAAHDRGELQSMEGESELQCSSVAFYDADSDLTSIFSPAPMRTDGDRDRYQEQIRSLEVDNVTLLDELNAMTGAKADAEKNETGLRAENEQLKSEVKLLRGEARELTDNVQRLEQTKNMLISIRSENDSLKLEAGKLASSNDALEKETSQLKAQIAELTTVSSDVNKLRPETARLQRELDEALFEARAVKEERGRLQDELAREKVKVDISAREHAAEKARLEGQIKHLQARDDDMQRDFSRTKDDLLKATQKVSQMESEIIYIRRLSDDEINRLDRELRRSHAEMADIAMENRRLKAVPPGGYGDPNPSSADDGYSRRLRQYRHSDYNASSETLHNGTNEHRIVDDGRDFYYDRAKTQPVATQSYQQPTYTTDPKLELQRPKPPRNLESYASAPTSAPSQEINRSSVDHSTSISSMARPMDNAESSSSSVRKTLGEIVGSKVSSSKTGTPFATDYSAAADHDAFDNLEKQLTSMMTEKQQLDEELSRLHQRGGKALKERVREQQVDARLIVLSKEISVLRKKLLAVKPA